MTYLNCLFIVVIFVIVSDKLHFWENFSPIISGWLTKGVIKKPIPSKIMTCSTCQSWWVNLLYIIFCGKFSVFMVTYILFLAYMAPVISDILELLTETLKTIIIKLNID